MLDKTYFVYILASTRNGTLYIGVTSDLIKRIWQHENGLVKGFTQKYSVHTLVYYEQFDTSSEAIEREKYLKGKKRNFKIQLIERMNSEWKDLYEEII